MSTASTEGVSITERVANVLTWGRIAFFVVVGLAGFGTFVAGEISGARTLEPRVTALETRADKTQDLLTRQGERLSEIAGYVKAIASTVGAKVGQ